MSASNTDLERFLADVRRGQFPAPCSEDEADELHRIAERPPYGLFLYKYGSRSVVGGFALKSGLETALKYYFPEGFFKQLAYGIGVSRCEQSWLAGLAFGFLGIPTPAPLAIRQWKCGPRVLRSFLATRHAPGISLREFVIRHPDAEQRLGHIARQLAAAFGIMSRHRIVHGDMKATNILIDEANGDAITFIDLDAAELLLPAAKWQPLREKDRKRFAKNWQSFPTAARIFKDVFDAADSDHA